ncbi:MAG: 4-hydroxy-tetrahydrodipicolinate reductase [Saprospiraceae bacterium]|nr:4-hydroxy-tetrahydrodipicolinate reductase [Saprospiraceae bacterium]
MKIALLGYGKMGKAIEEIALQSGNEIVMRISSANASELTQAKLQQSGAEVAIEFSRPETAFANIKTALEAGIPVVSGTTAWLDKMQELRVLVDQLRGAFFYASNFSLGVNILFHLNKKLAQIMEYQPEFDVRMKEIHHTQKLDAPSGTAITLAEGIVDTISRKSKWVKEVAGSPDELPIISLREANVPGTHEVIWSSETDEITIAHIAKSRAGFANGALLAASWLPGKQGCFGMEDLLSF